MLATAWQTRCRRYATARVPMIQWARTESGQGPPNNGRGQPPAPPGVPQQPYGQQQPGYGPPGYGPQPPGGFGGMPNQAMQMPGSGFVPDVGLFGHLPCPHCGTPTRSSAGNGGYAGRYAGGLVGWLIASAFLTKYYCPSHGEIPNERFPPAHQSAITTRQDHEGRRRRLAVRARPRAPRPRVAHPLACGRHHRPSSRRRRGDRSARASTSPSSSAGPTAPAPLLLRGHQAWRTLEVSR